MTKTKCHESGEPALSTSEQADLILGILFSFADDADSLFRFINHAEFDLTALRDASDLPAAWLGHYRIKNGQYDTARACNDLATWKPIASRIFELMREQRKGLAK